MKDEERDPIESLFHAARELHADARAEFLDEKCGPSSPERRTIEALLREDARQGPLDELATDALATTFTQGMHVGPYEIVSVAGIGGMGQVYRAVDRRLQRDVAIKALSVEFTHDRERMERLRREATLLASLNHPNIAGIYDVIERDGEPPCLVLEFVPGATLAELLSEGPFPIDKTLRVALQIASALEAAHEKGIVHRDLKPSNIKLTPAGKVKVLDFGLARVFTDSAGSVPASKDSSVIAAGCSSLAGTPSYMSPEQTQGVPVDQRADAWSFGCIVYELLTGRKALADRLHPAAAPQNEPDWTLLPPDTPAGLSLLLRQCLQTEREKRPNNGASLHRAIEELEDLNRTSPQTRAATATARSPISRRKKVWTAAVAVLVLAAVAGGLAWRSWPRARSPRVSAVPEANRYIALALEAATPAEGVTNAREALLRTRQLTLQALEMDPKYAAARVMYAFTLILEVDGGYSNSRDLLYQAERELQQALKDDPDSSDAHARLAFVYYYQGRKAEMREEANKALGIDPANFEAKMTLAIYHQLNGDYPMSQAILEELIAAGDSVGPGAALAARGNFAENLREMGEYDKAITEFTRVFELEPRAPASRVILASAYQTVGNLVESRRLLEGTLESDRSNYVFRLTWALQLALEDKGEEAMSEMDQELRISADLVYYSLYVAEFYAVLGQTTEALNWLDRAIRAGDERVDWFERDPHLASIRNESRFKQMIEPIRERRTQRAAPR